MQKAVSDGGRVVAAQEAGDPTTPRAELTGVLFAETREASGADSDFDSDSNPLLLLLAFRCLVWCVVRVCGGFSPVVHFFKLLCLFFKSFFFQPCERFLLPPPPRLGASEYVL